jgi:GT2 family glycosyltransferase
MNNLITIIIVNYNGANDTIACLESIFSSNIRSILRVVLIDNSSDDSSIEEINIWLQKSRIDKLANFRLGQIINKQVFCEHTDNFTHLFLMSDENYGFAIANNIGISFAIQSKSKYIMLLNNDTVVENSAIGYLFEYMENNQVNVVIPQIRLFFEPEKIWNCGGELTWYGTKRYNFSNQYYNALVVDPVFQVSFFTGCAVLFKAEVFEKVGLLSENYFFGTEDFNFSQRLVQSEIKVFCLMKSIVYHKVGQTISKESLSFSILNHYLGHFINQRKIVPFLFWIIWLVFYNMYIWIMITYRYRMGYIESCRLIFLLLKYSFVFDNVNKKNYLLLKNKF